MHSFIVGAGAEPNHLPFCDPRRTLDQGDAIGREDKRDFRGDSRAAEGANGEMNGNTGIPRNSPRPCWEAGQTAGGKVWGGEITWEDALFFQPSGPDAGEPA